MAGRKHKRIPRGERFERLVVVRFKGVADSGHAMYECRCDCGKKCIAQASGLRNGNNRSCGCLKDEVDRGVHRTHGDSGHPLWGLWRCMIQRCSNPKWWSYSWYGGRGIKVCERWQGVEGFRAFVADMGPRPAGTSLDRIDGDGHYEPGNVRWATRAEQARNRTQNVHLTHDGRTQTMCEWAAEVGVSIKTLHQRVKAGWDHTRAITTPVRVLRRRTNRP